MHRSGQAGRPGRRRQHPHCPLARVSLPMSEPNYRPENISRIFLLPNLMTAGNLIFGFLAILKIFEGSILREKGDPDWEHSYVVSLQCILVACLFDLLDGRLARLGGRESPFGREF